MVIRKMYTDPWLFQWPCGCGSKMLGALPDGAHSGLHRKPLDAAIRQVPVPYRPGGCHGIDGGENKNMLKTQLLANNLQWYNQPLTI